MNDETLNIWEGAEPELEPAQPIPAHPARPTVDAKQIRHFVKVMFKHATAGNWISLRSFYHDPKRPPFHILPCLVDADPHESAIAEARAAADATEGVVFAPPIATFGNPARARQQDLAEGLALTVEIDQPAAGSTIAAGRETLEALLGPATFVVASGGVTERGEPKLHLHWRLAVPTRDPAAHALLREARALATAIVGADKTSVAICHPIRWPGSLHTKGEPRLCKIIAENPKVEINLEAVLPALRSAAPPDVAIGSAGTGAQYNLGDPAHLAPSAGKVREALERLGNGSRYDERDAWTKVSHAIKASLGGAEAYFEIYDTWCQAGGRLADGRYTAEETRAMWDGIRDARLGWSWLCEEVREVTGFEYMNFGDSGKWVDLSKPAEGIGGQVVPKISGEGSTAPPAKDFLAENLALPEIDVVAELNKAHAFLVSGGKHVVMWFHIDNAGNEIVDYLKPATFIAKYAAYTVNGTDGEPVPVTSIWLKSKRRRTYDGIVFAPGQKVAPNYYNIWRGFTVEPYDHKKLPVQTGSDGWSRMNPIELALERWIENIAVNVCNNDPALFAWVMGFFAHLAQKPWEKTEIALVLRGKEGTGKNSVVEPIGDLLGDAHYLLFSNERYLKGNFNSAFEGKLLIVLDEALWAAGKEGEAILKDLITGKRFNIERKGLEPYTSANLARTAILANSEWAVPASKEARRFAVLNMQDTHKQDVPWFKTMRDGLRTPEGQGILLRYLQRFPLECVDLTRAPQNDALATQKFLSLPAVDQWWLACLRDGEIAGLMFHPEGTDRWPAFIPRDVLRETFLRWKKGAMPQDRGMSPESFGLWASRVLDAQGERKRRVGEPPRWVRVYLLPPLAQARSAWEAETGIRQDWEGEPS